MNETCPVCNGPAVLLGKLGDLIWFRCQNCGITFCKANEEIENETNTEAGME